MEELGEGVAAELQITVMEDRTVNTLFMGSLGDMIAAISVAVADTAWRAKDDIGEDPGVIVTKILGPALMDALGQVDTYREEGR